LYRPDANCGYNSESNMWVLCVWEDSCDPTMFGNANWTFAFGSDAAFNLPLSTLLVNYTSGGAAWCALAVQSVEMPFDMYTERHFYFGDIFYENFAGIFDFNTGKIGMALSKYAPDTVSFDCAGGCVEPEPIPDPPTPEPKPVPVPGDDSSSDSHLLWLWIVIGLALLILILVLLACYYRKKASR